MPVEEITGLWSLSLRALQWRVEESNQVEGTELSKLEEIIEMEGRGELLQMKESHNYRWRLRWVF